VPIGAAQEFDGLNTQHFAGHALLPLARQHEIGIEKARNLAAFRANEKKGLDMQYAEGFRRIKLYVPKGEKKEAEES
jgi:hypothetical protein